MGLDVSVYKNIQLIENENEDYDFIASIPYDGWKYKIKNLKENTEYKGDYADADLTCGYSSHNRFRELLIKIIGREDLLLPDGTIDWDKLENEKNIPFYELINFSDCEGCLDFEICNILYNNFVEWKDEAEKYLADNKYYMNKYLQWLNIFKEGKEENCVVQFH